MTHAELALLRRYDRLRTGRHRSGLTRVSDGRANPLFREWLAENKLTYSNRKEYKQLHQEFRRACARAEAEA